jgi:Phosphomethylpyrimidine kinase
MCCIQAACTLVLIYKIYPMGRTASRITTWFILQGPCYNNWEWQCDLILYHCIYSKYLHFWRCKGSLQDLAPSSDGSCHHFSTRLSRVLARAHIVHHCYLYECCLCRFLLVVCTRVSVGARVIKPPSSLASPSSSSSIHPASTSPSALATTAFFSSADFCVHKTPQLAKPPVAYALAGSDSGGVAGTQADLHAIRTLGCHVCAVITWFTTPDNVGVNRVESVLLDMTCSQCECLSCDMPPTAVKIGMTDLHKAAETICDVSNSDSTLSSWSPAQSTRQATDTVSSSVWIVLYPVMISTSCHSLMQESAKQVRFVHISAEVFLLTPNKL